MVQPVIMYSMNLRLAVSAALLSVLGLLSGCAHKAPAPAPDPLALDATPDPATNWAIVLRDSDEVGLVRNDKRTVTDADDLNRLRSFFPELNGRGNSNLHGGWHPSVVVRFHSASGGDTYVPCDYHLYRIGEGARGDYVVREGFGDYIDELFRRPVAPPAQ